MLFLALRTQFHCIVNISGTVGANSVDKHGPLTICRGDQTGILRFQPRTNLGYLLRSYIVSSESSREIVNLFFRFSLSLQQFQNYVYPWHRERVNFYKRIWLDLGYSPAYSA